MTWNREAEFAWGASHGLPRPDDPRLLTIRDLQGRSVEAEKARKERAIKCSIGRRRALLSGISWPASFLLLAQIFSWQQATLISVLVLVHEAGHALTGLHFKREIRWFFFAVFFGGVVFDKRDDTGWMREDFWISIAGPASGIPLGLALLVFPSWRWAATVVTIINLINLVPFLPLDGGRIAACILAPLGWPLRTGGAALIASFIWFVVLGHDVLPGFFFGLFAPGFTVYLGGPMKSDITPEASRAMLAVLAVITVSLLALATIALRLGGASNLPILLIP